ncbi:E3 ubiquitin-protein ligase MARCHF3 [Hypomesus transpacificus]|uniref:E3 ubiquitin-protein ligase MARCHF3 n=1 Tax=Hypomesus transpacificus TaxID=137520 RepID=UPI001F085D69|nr:E3 ubiquitin-protein ligase MARCHF3 [Hypomesus transpacificus]
MAPYVKAMESEQPLGPCMGSPVREIKFVPEEGQGEESYTCKQEVLDSHSYSPGMDHSTESLSSEEPFCRICHDGRQAGELLSPCECAGSLAMVHRGCLEHWLTTSNSSQCELCRHQFALERLPKPLTEWLCTPSMQHQRRTLCGDMICFLCITPLASLSGWLCVQGAMDLYSNNRMEAVGLLVLTMALFTIYFFWTMVSLRYHIQLFRTWKQTDQRVRLQTPRPECVPTNHRTQSFNFLSKNTSKETVV